MKYAITKIIIDNSALSTIESIFENSRKIAYSLLTDEPYDAEQILSRLKERLEWQISGLYHYKVALPCPNPYGDDNYPAELVDIDKLASETEYNIPGWWFDSDLRQTIIDAGFDPDNLPAGTTHIIGSGISTNGWPRYVNLNFTQEFSDKIKEEWNLYKGRESDYK